MGLNIGTFNNSIIDSNALTRVTEQILNPNKEVRVDVSKLDLSKFNRISLGTDIYSAGTSTETAIQTAKAVTDFDLNLSNSFSANVQYLNSVAAQSLFSSKGNTENVDNAQKINPNEVVLATSNIDETANMQKDRRGSNPFSFYVNVNEKDDDNDFEQVNFNSYSGLNIFA